MLTTPQRVLQRYKKMQEAKTPWLPLYQLLGEFIMTRKQAFTVDSVPGEFLTNRIFDRTAPNAYHLMTSSLIGALWPNGAKSFRIAMPEALKGTEFENVETKGFYERATKIMVEKIDHPRAGFKSGLEEYMGDQVVFGISGMGAFENDDLEVPVQFTAVDVKRVAVAEGSDGFVDTVYIEKEFTVRQMVQEYGEKALSKPVKDKWDAGKCDEKVRVLHAIEPRMEYDPYKYGSEDMPVASIHIEIQTGKKLRESGFTELPVFVTRFWKVIGEIQGRSPGMEALSDVTEINAMREASIIAIEKSLDPPLAVFDDGGLGGGTIDTSAGAINVFSVSGRMTQSNRDPVQPLVEGGELNTTYARITELKEEIRNAFFLDRLMDFNNEQRMTAYETSVRNGFRGQSLGTVYSRQMTELFTPLIERVFNILLRKGLFGVLQGSQEEAEILENGGTPMYIPEQIANLMLNGKDVYKIEYISPAAKIMQTEELQGIEATITTAMNVAGVAGPDVLDNIDLDQTIRTVQDLTGAPSRIMRDLKTVQKIRDAREQQMKAQAELEAARSQSETARNMGQAASTLSAVDGDRQAA